MQVTRESSQWPVQVLAAINEYIPQASMGEELRIWPVATWLDGVYVHIVYRKRHLRGLFGFRYDTRSGITGTDWPEPETIGQEIVQYALWEPHDDAPPEYSTDQIYWWGDVTDNLPARQEDLPK